MEGRKMLSQIFLPVIFLPVFVVFVGGKDL